MENWRALPSVNSLWIGGSLSPLERLTINSFMRMGHGFNLYAYGYIENLPSGVVVVDANDIIKEQESFLSHGSYAHFADWFRWKFLQSHGGYWVDMDVVCLRSFSFISDIVFGFEAGKLPNVAVLRFPSEHPVCSAMENRCANPNAIREGDNMRDIYRKFRRRFIQGNERGSIKWGEAGGPSGFQRVLSKSNLLECGLPFTYFYPVHWTNAASIFDATLSRDESMFSDSHAIHLWNDQLRKLKINKQGPFEKNSLITKLLDQNGV